MGQVSLRRTSMCPQPLCDVSLAQITAYPCCTQTMSFGLTQYDMEELMTFTNHQCAHLPRSSHRHACGFVPDLLFAV